MTKIPGPLRVLPLLSLASLAGCLDSLGSSSNTATGAGGNVLPLEDEPRVDLPGRVSVFFQVLGREGVGIAGLEGTDFELFEDGTPVSQTESKQRLLAKPRVFRSYSMLLLDRSGSIAQSPTGELEQIEAAKAYIELVTQAPESFVSLAWFDGAADIRPLLLDDFTELGFSNNRDELFEAIGNLHDEAPTSTSTNLNGAILRGLERLDAVDLEAEQRGIDFRALTLVTFTDGTDQAGTTSIEEVKVRLAEIEPVSGRKRYRAFTIGLGSEINQDALRQLGPDGFEFALGFGDLTPQFQSIAQAVADVANSFYFLSYCSPKQDGSGLHTLTVRLRTPDVAASEEYLFSADYFSGGCGFVDFFQPSEETAAWFVGAMEADDQGRVVLVGSKSSAGTSAARMVVMRLRPDGTLDPTFGSLGRVIVSQAEGFGSLRATSLDFDPDGTLVVGGLVGDGDLASGSTRAALWRFDEEGVLVASDVLPAYSQDGDALNDLAIDSERRIVAVGRVGRAASRSAVWRFLPSLEPDASFVSPEGLYLRQAHAIPADTALVLALAEDDAIFAAGTAHSGIFGGPDLDVFKLLPSGSLDTSFGTGGAVRGDAFQTQVAGAPTSLTLDSQGRVVLGGGYLEAGQPTRSALWRLRPDGSPDVGFLGSPSARFFATGMVTLPRELTREPRILFSDESRIADLDVHTDDTLLVAGLRRNAAGHTDVAMWRYGVEGRLVPAYNGTGFLIDDGALGPGTDEGAEEILIHPDGRIFAAGRARRAGAAATDEELGVWIDSEAERVFAPTGDN